jgi:heme/copper-type cytochrome/quinol oxidase subunit 2
MFTQKFRRLLIAILALWLVAAASSWAAACPTCKDALAQHDPEHANLVRGYFWSILFMMSMPFLILGGLSAYLYFEVRRARAKRGLAPPALGGARQPRPELAHL